MPTVYIRGVTIHTVDYTDEGEHKEAIVTNACSEIHGLPAGASPFFGALSENSIAVTL